MEGNIGPNYRSVISAFLAKDIALMPSVSFRKLMLPACQLRGPVRETSAG